MNPANLFRKSVAALNDWFEKAEREEMEQRREVLGSPPEPPQPRERISRDLDGSKIIDFRGAEPPPAGIAEVVRAPGNLTPVPMDSRDASMTPTTGLSAGTPPIRSRTDVHTPSPEEIVFAARNDGAFRERNRLVREIGERYSRYGDAVASTVLQKCLVEDGVQLLVTKLGLTPEGEDAADHKQIIRFIEEQGVPKFCELMGVRGAAKERDRPPPASTHPKVKVAQNLTGQGKKDGGESRVLQMESVNVRPVTLGPQDSEGGKEKAPAPPEPLAQPGESPKLPFPFAHRTLPPAPEGFHEPKRLEPTDVSPVPLRPADKQPAPPKLQRVKAAPFPLSKKEKDPEPRERGAADFLREVTQDED